jgi:hypothetical protein
LISCIVLKILKKLFTYLWTGQLGDATIVCSFGILVWIDRRFTLFSVPNTIRFSAGTANNNSADMRFPKGGVVR